MIRLAIRSQIAEILCVKIWEKIEGFVEKGTGSWVLRGGATRVDQRVRCDYGLEQGSGICLTNLGQVS